MSKLVHKIKSSIQIKLFIICLLIVQIPVLFFGTLSYRLTAASIERDFINNKIFLGQQSLISLEESNKNLVRQAMGIYAYDEELTMVLSYSSANYGIDYTNAFSHLEKRLNVLMQANTNIFGITLVDGNGNIKIYLDRQYGHTKALNVSDIQWFTEAMQKKGQYVFLNPHKNTYLLGSSYQPDVFGIAAGVVDFVSSTPIGVMKIDQSPSILLDIMEGMDPVKEEVILILGKNNTIISSNVPLTNEQIISLTTNIISNDITTSKVNLEGQNVLVNKIVSNTNGWSIVSIIPTSILATKSDFIKNINYTLLLVTTISMLFVSLYLASLLVSPIKKLMSAFSKLKNGDFDASVDVSGDDEIAQINTSFNEMAISIKTLISEKYEANLNRLQAELEVLQSQINPHFLYNTLNSIKALADINKMYDISIMIKNLSDLFRYNLNTSRHVVSLSDEINHLKNYLYLQQIRFSDKYKVEWHIDPSALQCECLRLVLQPIAENAIIHGFKNIIKGGILRVEIFLQNENLSISISNNGDLISDDALHQINQALAHETLSQLKLRTEKIGIYNVNTRIKLYFGNAYGLHFMIKEGFTCVTINLPIKNERE
ncbi:MAG: histidine kinase [Vallitaleaceae bacterium]|nr:histidine kinase [Vallitaleaceae bacterium]